MQAAVILPEWLQVLEYQFGLEILYTWRGNGTRTDADARGKIKIRVLSVYPCPISIQIDIQIRTVKPVVAVGTDDLAVHLAQLASAAVTHKNALLVDGLRTLNL